MIYQSNPQQEKNPSPPQESTPSGTPLPVARAPSRPSKTKSLVLDGSFMYEAPAILNEAQASLKNIHVLLFTLNFFS